MPMINLKPYLLSYCLPQGSFPSTLESNRSTRHHGLVERVQRDRRFISPVRPYRNRQVSFSSLSIVNPQAFTGWGWSCFNLSRNLTKRPKPNRKLVRLPVCGFRFQPWILMWRILSKEYRIIRPLLWTLNLFFAPGPYRVCDSHHRAWISTQSMSLTFKSFHKKL